MIITFWLTPSRFDKLSYSFRRIGEVSEWFKEHAWKACVRLRVPRVRIPPSPPHLPLNSGVRVTAGPSTWSGPDGSSHDGVRWCASGSGLIGFLSLGSPVFLQRCFFPQPCFPLFSRCSLLKNTLLVSVEISRKSQPSSAGIPRAS